MTQTQEREIKRLYDAFKRADKDCDDLLNKEEFFDFVEIAYRKQCPSRMYEKICNRFKRNMCDGIDWNTAKTIYVEANNVKKEIQEASASHTSHSSSADSSASHFIRRQDSITMSQSSVISELEAESNININGFDRKSIATLSSNGIHRKSRSRLSLHNNNSLSFESNANDTSSMIVDILDQKNKSLQNKLILQRTKRKKTQEIAQSLLKQNEEYKIQIDSLQNKAATLQQENNSLNLKVCTLQNQVDEDKNSIQYLKEERKTMKSELDEAYNLWTKLEKEHNAIIKKMKQKQKAEIEKLYAGFLESLGIKKEKCSDVTTVIKTLKNSNVELKNTVDTLAESLARKQRSLLEALQAVDNIAINDEKTQNELIRYKNEENNTQIIAENKIKTRFKEWKQRRKSLHGISRKLSNGLQGIYNKRRKSLIKEDEEAIYENNASFIINMKQDADDNNTLNVNNANHPKEMQFLSQKLTQDVAKKTQSIENLSIANTVLFEKMEKMKQEMQEMKQLKDVYDQQKSASFDNENNE